MLGALQTDKSIQLSHTSRGLGWSLSGTLTVGSVSVSSHVLRSAVSVDSHVMTLTWEHCMIPLAHTIPLPFVQENAWSSAECLAEDFYICFHQLLGSHQFRVVTNLITGDGPSSLLLGGLAGFSSLCWVTSPSLDAWGEFGPAST